MTNETITLILAALTAFFTLITGALAIAVTIGILYFKKLASDRQAEVKKLIDLQSEVAKKIKEAEKVLQNLGIDKGDITRISSELSDLKREYTKISSQFYPAPNVPSPLAGTSPYDYSGASPSIADLQAQIAALLSQIYELQKQLSEV